MHETMYETQKNGINIWKNISTIIVYMPFTIQNLVFKLHSTKYIRQLSQIYF